MNDAIIAAAGAGRMGRGLSIVFAYAGHPVQLIDLKQREDPADYLNAAKGEVLSTLEMLVACGMLHKADIDRIAGRIDYIGAEHATDALRQSDVIFEAAPETVEAKQTALQFISEACRSDVTIASTTSTFLSDKLQAMVTGPERLLNAHWLNPAFLVPLVEVSPAEKTDPDVTARLVALLEGVGKTPVVCKASPGFIVPRLQALCLNEAARMCEEGVASPEDIDKATKYGFGFRFAILGMLEFIDWGGGDILHYASRNMVEATGEDRFSAPRIVTDNMEAGRIGLRTGAGFLNYEGMDIPAYQQTRLRAFVEMLKHMELLQPPR
ncbi:MAG: 3-hydroxybutyryl-CoA dehydrogenase [Hyphomicrobiales bacterium]|nr:3-hydroxybutyryl-CoA dehydrogenase [Hyphomicrobiales bacterium]MCP4999936.1 3-hydroxybutyryl-CoA dehydrogenase [Hyphomicrobiales bacterium]